jgi:ribonuclease P protein component
VRAVPRVVIASASDDGGRFPTGRRLHKPQEFAAVLSARLVLRGESFDLHFRKNDLQEPARLGLVVPKRLARAANLRNTVKRQGREAFRHMSLQLPACDVVLRLKRPLAVTSEERKVQKQLWRREIESLMQRLVTRGT